jgi:hypothetical protein
MTVYVYHISIVTPQLDDESYIVFQKRVALTKLFINVLISKDNS